MTNKLRTTKEGNFVSEKTNTNYTSLTEIETKEEFSVFLSNRNQVFVSHSSSTNEPPGIQDFVKDVVKELKEYYGQLNIFFDEDENLSTIPMELDNAINRARYGVVFFSKRYIERYGLNSNITGELNRFITLNGEYHVDFVAPILFGIDRGNFGTKGIFSFSGKKYIEVNMYSPEQKEKESDRITSLIINCLDSFDDKYKVEDGKKLKNIKFQS